jgi:hypothetical protein
MKQQVDKATLEKHKNTQLRDKVNLWRKPANKHAVAKEKRERSDTHK